MKIIYYLFSIINYYNSLKITLNKRNNFKELMGDWTSTSYQNWNNISFKPNHFFSDLYWQKITKKNNQKIYLQKKVNKADKNSQLYKKYRNPSQPPKNVRTYIQQGGNFH